ncbi:MAG: response regulator [Geminocystis sp.]|nr:response regulator [Geminocystis sp.]MCS7148703.1 response regulator [Geminocystis sp.]MCX8078422.1 response regulator [Geminocystis sp.]MDW8463511.1 response regulator [Geminocystis sp.]HIK37817.1 response regulator [Geminocystis sp. M7585_C2015_104]
MITSEQAQKVQQIYKNTLIRLGEMLKVLKQGDSSRNREVIRSHCDHLSILGKKENLFGWVEIMETAKEAIINPENEYDSTIKLIIKEIKKASDLLLKHEIDQICVSEQLLSLAPQARGRGISGETIHMEESPVKGESAATSPIPPTPPQSTRKVPYYKSTIEGDLWRDTIEMQIPEMQMPAPPPPSPSQEEMEEMFSSIGKEKDEDLEAWFGDNEEIESEFTSVFMENSQISESNSAVEVVEGFSSLFGQIETESVEEDKWDLEGDEGIEREQSHSAPMGAEEEAPVFSAEADELQEVDWDSLFGEEEEGEEEDRGEDKTAADSGEEVGITAIDFDALAEDLEEIEEIIDNEWEEEKEGGKRISDSARRTVIIDDPHETLQGVVSSIEDVPIEDDFPNTGSTETFQILSPKKPQIKIVFYEDFSELPNLLSPSLSWLELESWDELEAIVGNNYVLYYDCEEELEALINSPPVAPVNWQYLTELVAGNLSRTGGDLTTQKTTTLTDLDRLLAQVDRVVQKGTRTARVQNKATAQQNKGFEQSMRVPVKQLDQLNNLIGEIVVRRNHLEEDQEKLRQFLDNLLQYVQALSDVGTRMQELYERSLLEGALIKSRRRNQAAFKTQFSRITYVGNGNGSKTTTSEQANGTTKIQPPELDELELDRFTGFHLLSQEIIELIVRVREAASDIQFLVDETEQLGRNLREITTQLQEGINKARMVPFAQNADRLPLPIRKIAEEYNKQVQLKIEGRDVLIDKMILEQIWDPLLQIVKNSVTHGIELPEERIEMGKPPVGTITVRAFLQGQQTVISVSDDGAGIDPQKIKKKAIQNKLITPEEAQNLTTEEVYEFLFHAGFTTKEQADSHAGRGVGLDIVRKKINEIRGSVSVESTPGVGTTFTIRLPLTVTVSKALCCLNENYRIAFPMDAIEDTREINRKEVRVNAQGQKCILWKNTLLPFRPLSALLTYNRPLNRTMMYETHKDEENISIVVLRGGKNILAVQVDQIIGQEEIVVKQITGPIPKPKGIAAATVRSDGIVMPIADVIELIEIAQGRVKPHGGFDRASLLAANATIFEMPAHSQPVVLVVDDSITVREMLSMTFAKAGYRVEQARDGQDAWKKLRSGLPVDLVFSDIEMPNMNGLELLQHMQEDPHLSHIPVAILSSRGAEKHQRIAAELGASAYLVKPYVEKDLLDAAKRMLKGEVLLAGSRAALTRGKANQSHQSQSQQLPGNTEVQNKPKSSRLVLIVDDSVVVREMLSMTFKKAGWRVEQARDGQDAWDKISNGLPCDLILCDIEMPRMNGLELLAKMQQDENLSRIPVAMVTSRGAEKHRKIAADLGAKAYFTKPYLEEELLKAAEKLIAGEVLL